MSDRIRTLVVDDEPAARRGICMLLDGDPEIEVVGTCADGAEAVEALRSLEPDLVFLDVQMPEYDGFEVLAGIDRDETPAVVFVTAYDEHALRAFEVHAVDYLLKPYNDLRFGESLERAKRFLRGGRLQEFRDRLAAMLDELGSRVAAGDGSAAPTPGREDDRAAGRGTVRFPIQYGGRITFVDAADVWWISAERDYVRLHTPERSYLMRETMKDLEESLGGLGFVRVHRSALVRLAAVERLEKRANGRLAAVMPDGTEVSVSRSGRDRLRDAIGKPI